MSATQAKLEAGAELLYASTMPDGAGYYHPITILTGGACPSPAVGVSAWGPTLAITPFRDLEEVLIDADARPVGATSVWSDPDHGAAVAARLDAGRVLLNPNCEALTRSMKAIGEADFQKVDQQSAAAGEVVL